MAEVLKTLSDVLALSGADESKAEVQMNPANQTQYHAEGQWRGAIAALNTLLSQGRSSQSRPAGVVLAGPTPILSHRDLVRDFASWTFASQPHHSTPRLPSQLLPGGVACPVSAFPESRILPVPNTDPTSAEPFCLVLTPEFSLVMVLGRDAAGEPRFQFSFEPDAVRQSWISLRSRVLQHNPHQIGAIAALVEQFPPIAPHYKTVMRFSQLLLQHLSQDAPSDRAARSVRRPLRPLPRNTVETRSQGSKVAKSNLDWPKLRRQLHVKGVKAKHPSVAANPQPQAAPDVELLQAIAHEVRTPLTTIRTLTRLLLRRKDLDAKVTKRLETIDRECTEQIDRFDLIFRAVEIETCETARSPVQLTSTPLSQVFDCCIPRWQKQASRRNLTLDVLLPQHMPSVVSDPNLLDRVLTGAIENYTSTLPSGSHVEVQVMLAGSQIKLQLKSQTNCNGNNGVASQLKSLGNLLMFQPETGNLSLNLSVTKNLFQALGGKLIVRNRPHQGEVLTIFLPLE